MKKSDSGEIILSGRFDASQVEEADKVFDTIMESCIVNFGDLDYISSAGLGILLKTQKRLSDSGGKLKLTHINKHIEDVFQFAGFDTIFEIE